MNSYRKEVLFLGWTSKGRDIDIDLPLMYFFKNILNWNVSHMTIFNLPKILRTNPDIIIMTNTTGGTRQVEVSKLIQESGFPFFSHVSEGMFRKDSIEEFVWGWNKRNNGLSETLSMLWSKKSLDLATSFYPETKEILRFSGAVGFDKYKFLTHENLGKTDYKKVIGYAGFDFHNIILKKEKLTKQYGPEVFTNLMSLLKLSQSILDKLITKNPDILFLIKSHPGDGENSVPLELKNIQKRENIRLVDKNISIVDVIGNSDVWLNVNSSTNLEAWLMGKPSISFLVDENRFSSDVLYGSITEDNYVVIQSYLDEFYSNGSINEFNLKNSTREKLISDYIGFSDGLNHARFMSFLRPFIDRSHSNNSPKGKWKISMASIIKSYIQHYLYLFSKGRYDLPFFKRWAEYYDIYKDDELDRNKDKFAKSMDGFYKTNYLQIKDIYENFNDEEF